MSGTFKKLTARQRALVSIGVLLDGREAQAFLANDSDMKNEFSKAAEELAVQPPDLRMPYVATQLRSAITELESDK